MDAGSVEILNEAVINFVELLPKKMARAPNPPGILSVASQVARDLLDTQSSAGISLFLSIVMSTDPAYIAASSELQ